MFYLASFTHCITIKLHTFFFFFLSNNQTKLKTIRAGQQQTLKGSEALVPIYMALAVTQTHQKKSRLLKKSLNMCFILFCFFEKRVNYSN